MNKDAFYTFLGGMAIGALFVVIIVLSTREAFSMSQEEIFYYFGLKNTGEAQVYESREGQLFDTIENCLESGTASCSFTLRDTFENEEVMRERFNEFMKLHRNE